MNGLHVFELMSDGLCPRHQPLDDANRSLQRERDEDKNSILRNFPCNILFMGFAVVR